MIFLFTLPLLMCYVQENSGNCCAVCINLRISVIALNSASLYVNAILSISNKFIKISLPKEPIHVKLSREPKQNSGQIKYVLGRLIMFLLNLQNFLLSS